MTYHVLLVLLAIITKAFVVADYPQPDGSKEFDFTVTWDQHDQAGISREMFLINGQSPGPVIEVEQDDNVIVRVQNDSPFDITIHYHGTQNSQPRQQVKSRLMLYRY